MDSEKDPEDFLEFVEKDKELLEALEEETGEYSDNDNYEEVKEFWKEFALAINQRIGLFRLINTFLKVIQSAYFWYKSEKTFHVY